LEKTPRVTYKLQSDNADGKVRRTPPAVRHAEKPEYALVWLAKGLREAFRPPGNLDTKKPVPRGIFCFAAECTALVAGSSGVRY
jgi:hypothetical protein